MRSLNPPAVADDLLLEKLTAYYSALGSVAASLKGAYQDYKSKAAIGVVPLGLEDEQGAAMGTAYRSKATSAGMAWINLLHSGHALNFCPLCGGPGARTIDHHLPFAHYPEFSVFSWNLLPSCSTCNAKRNASNEPGQLTTLHPYFDGAMLDRPLIFTQVRKPWDMPAFKLRRIIPLDPLARARQKNHIETAIDAKAFGTWTNGAWGDLRAKRASRHASSASLREDLEFELRAETQHGNRNSWNASLLRGVLRVPELIEWLVSNQLDTRSMTSSELGT